MVLSPCPHSGDDIPDRNPPPTSEILAGARTGSPGGFDQLYGRIAPALFAWCRLRVDPGLRSALDPEDVVQEVWCRALRRFDTYDATRASFRRWIFGIANRVLLEGFRRVNAPDRAFGSPADRASPLDAVPDEVTSLSRRLARDENLQQFVDNVQALHHPEREILVYLGLEELDLDEVAELVGLTREATRKRWQRLCTRLRQEKGWQDLLAE